MTAILEPLTSGGRTVLTGSIGAPRLRDVGYAETEWKCSGDAVSYVAPSGQDADGFWALVEDRHAPFVTRVVVRRPVDPATFSGTVVVEWLNVSSGSDAAPLYGFLAPELFRQGHAWVGVSAQWAGIVAAPPLVGIEHEGGVTLVGLLDADPERYGDLSHPGDAYCFDIFTKCATAVTSADGSPLADMDACRVIAAGESQSGYALTTYANGVQPITRCFDGFLIHSRGGPAMPLGEPGRGIDLEAGRADPAVRIRTDLAEPVLVVETETDLLGHLRYLPARQPDAERLRTWEVAGAAHADRSIVGEFESMLGCPDPVNRGQQRFVVRAALRHLDRWAGGGEPPPACTPIEVDERPDGATFVTDDLGNALGGVRTPCVETPVEVLSGLGAPAPSRICQLFGRTTPAPEESLRRRYDGVEDYLHRYTAAVDMTISAGFALAEDRDELVADARPEVITW